MQSDLKQIRNIGVIAHIDAGKTTVTEKMLYYSKAVHKVGAVDQGTTVTDFDPEERERGITIRSACVSFKWNQYNFNLIDTPGHADFTAEVERSLRVLDGGVVVFSAREGVEAQSETVWRQADKYHVPRIAFINKMDREGADFYGTVQQIEKVLDAKPIIAAIPVGEGPPHVPEAFRGMIDLISMKQLTFDGESKGEHVTFSEIEEGMVQQAKFYREKFLDDLSLYSDALTELLLSHEEVPELMLRAVLREATIHAMAVPVFCGSALDGIGVQPVMDAVCYYLPSPADIPPVKGLDPIDTKGAILIREADPKEPFCGLVFKITADKHADLCYLRVYSGTLKPNTRVQNPRANTKENIPQLWRIHADDREQIQEVCAGDICGVLGLPASITGDTLCDTRHPILLEQITFPETVISMAIEPDSSEEHKKLDAALKMLRREDPTFLASVNNDTGQTLISGMGELHLEIIKNRLLRDHKVKVRIHHPRVSYRESIQNGVSVTGCCQKTLGGVRHFAEITIKIEPIFDGSQAVEVLDHCKDEAFKAEYKNIVLESLREESLGGGQLGFPLFSTKLTVLGGSFDDGTTTEVALRIATGDAYRKGLEAAGIVLLEPVMRLEIATPDEHVGDLVGDLNQRRGIVTQTNNRGQRTIIEAEAPLSNLFGYSSAILGLTKGRASCSMELLSYKPAAPEALKSFMLD